MQATSLEGPPLSEEEGWAMSDADTCEAALAALHAVSSGGQAACWGKGGCSRTWAHSTPHVLHTYALVSFACTVSMLIDA